MKRLTAILAILLSVSSLRAQNPESSTTTSQPADVQLNNGVGLGYRVTKATGLTVNVSKGMIQCVDQWIDYSGGTVSLTDNTTNYVVLDPTQNCAPAAILAAALSQGTFWLAKVTTSGGVVTAIHYARTGVAISQVSTTAGSGGTSGSGGGANATGNFLTAGCGVNWTGGLNFTVSACTYLIAGTQYTSPQTDLTLDAADGTYDRIDLIAVNSSATAEKITGTASGTPAEPSFDPATELRLVAVTVPAGGSTPTGVSNVDLYQENTEYTCAVSSNLNCASTNNPFAGSLDIEATAAVAGNNVTLTKPSGTIDLSGYSNLILYIRSKAAWPNAKTLSFFWQNSSTNVGSSVALRTGLLGFSSSVTSSYQQVVIPISSFATGATVVNKLKVAVAGSGGSIGFYLDSIYLQAGTGGTSSNSVACSQLPALTGDVTTAGATCTTLIPAASIANSKLNSATITVNGTSCTLGSSCAPAGSGAVGTSGSPLSGQTAIFTGAASITGGAVTSQSGTYTAAATDYAILCSSTFTLTLPSGQNAGKTYRVKNVGTGTITISPASGTIDGASTATLDTQYQAVDVIFDGTNWEIF